MISVKSRKRPVPSLVLALLFGAVLAAPLAVRAAEDDDAAAVRQAKALSRAFRAAANAVLPTVVKVNTTTRIPVAEGNPFRGTPFEDLFPDDPRGQNPHDGMPGLGSGVIIDPSGVILTNNHVIKDADEVSVQLADGRQFDVIEMHGDEATDLAVLRIEVDEPLPAAKLGDSDRLEIGDWVLAIGNPFNMELTVSAGIISAKGRSLSRVTRARFLQTDAAINPGNSGGPLVNLDGEVVGINTAIFSRTGGYQGIGFAIPINVAKWVTPQLVEGGTVRRAYIGVSIGPVPPERIEELGALPREAVVVSETYEGAPAEKAGLQVDDVILSFDDHRIRNGSDLQEAVERSAPDSSHQLKILRERQPMTLQIVVQAMPEGFGTTRPARAPSSGYILDKELGLAVGELTPPRARAMGLQGFSGVLVVHADRNRIAGRAGLAEGMLIRAINDTKVKNLQEFQAAMDEASLEEGIRLDVRTRDSSLEIVLKSG